MTILFINSSGFFFILYRLLISCRVSRYDKRNSSQHDSKLGVTYFAIPIFVDCFNHLLHLYWLDLAWEMLEDKPDENQSIVDDNNEHMDPILLDRSRAYVTSPNFRLNYFFLRWSGTGPIFVRKQFLNINIHAFV